MNPLLHTGAGHAAGADNPLYAVMGEHRGALVGIALMIAVLAFGRRRLRPLEHPIASLLAISAAAHAGLVPWHLDSPLGPLFALDAVALAVLARRAFAGTLQRRHGLVLVVLNLIAYVVAAFAGDAPDQVTILTKLAELAALVLLLEQRPRRRNVPLAVGAVLATGMAAWVGAFQAPVDPGMAMRVPDREATAAEQRAVERFTSVASAALVRYRDVAVARREGYAVDDVFGDDFHAANAGNARDGRVFDPRRPESLVYAESARGPILLGAVFEVSELGQRGPTIGGPLTVWHEHVHVCLTAIPPFFSGLESPFGGCPPPGGQIARTAEMIHLWLIPGLDHPFGELADRDRATYLARMRA